MEPAMTTLPAAGLAVFAARAEEVAALLKLMGHRARLMVLCTLAERGEMRVGDLAEAVDLSQSALSQHLAKMRDEGLVDFRREAQALLYRIADPRCEALLGALHELYCSGDDGEWC
jgi:ArsR family transcriptional regulator